MIHDNHPKIVIITFLNSDTISGAKFPMMAIRNSGMSDIGGFETPMRDTGLPGPLPLPYRALTIQFDKLPLVMPVPHKNIL